VDKIREREEHGRRFSIVVVAVGALPAGGTPSFVGETRRYGGIAERIAQDIEALCGKETRSLVLGHIQRGGEPNPYDRNLALRFGAAAVRCVERGSYGSMVALQGKVIRPVPLGDAIEQVKRVPPDSEVVLTARRLGLSFGDVQRAGRSCQHVARCTLHPFPTSPAWW
jgi:6-phosphofructokinase 1